MASNILTNLLLNRILAVSFEVDTNENTQYLTEEQINELRQQHTSQESDDLPPPLEEDQSSSSALCSICLETITESQETIRLPCTHTFHDECVTRWLRQHSTCPVCRTNMLPTQEQTQTQNTNTNPTRNLPSIIFPSLLSNLNRNLIQNLEIDITFMMPNRETLRSRWNPSIDKIYDVFKFLYRVLNVSSNQNQIAIINRGATMMFFTSTQSFQSLNYTLNEYSINRNCIFEVLVQQII